uniref:Uncharacterized protein n=1 Tax=Anguilla anguilla TaxID=7936 RepID=A0A0E9RSL9_ANGAN
MYDTLRFSECGLPLVMYALRYMIGPCMVRDIFRFLPIWASAVRFIFSTVYDYLNKIRY